MSGYQQISPLSFRPNFSPYISYIFNKLMRQHQSDTTNYAPILKFGFYGNGNHMSERMFTSEESMYMISFVKNVSLEPPYNSIRRSFYMIARSKVHYLHYKTGIIFKDLFDYAYLEDEEVSKYFVFQHNERIYTKISEIIPTDVNYKNNTKIIFKSNNTEFYNDMFYYLHTIPMIDNSYKEPELKIGYYIPESSLSSFHVSNHISSCFSLRTDRTQLYNSIINNFSTLDVLLQTNFSEGLSSSNEYMEEGKTVKILFIGSSLSIMVSSTDKIQQKRIYIAWFIAEILYGLFFNN